MNTVDFKLRSFVLTYRPEEGPRATERKAAFRMFTTRDYPSLETALPVSPMARRFWTDFVFLSSSNNNTVTLTVITSSISMKFSNERDFIKTKRKWYFWFNWSFISYGYINLLKGLSSGLISKGRRQKWIASITIEFQSVTNRLSVEKAQQSRSQGETFQRGEKINRRRALRGWALGGREIKKKRRGDLSELAQVRSKLGRVYEGEQLLYVCICRFNLAYLRHWLRA